MDAPGGVTWSGGKFFVADFYNHRVDVLGAGRSDVLGRPGRVWPGRIHYPTDVADFENHRVQLFPDRGRYLGQGQVADSLLRPTDMVEGARGELYVVDFGHDRVVRFEPYTR